MPSAELRKATGWHKRLNTQLHVQLQTSPANGPDPHVLSLLLNFHPSNALPHHTPVSTMCAINLLACRLWLQALPARSGMVPPSAAAARQGAAVNPFKTLRRVVVQSGRVARPGAKGQREEWAVKFEGYNSREQVRTELWTCNAFPQQCVGRVGLCDAWWAVE